MGSKYKNVKPVGQEDKNACWAASLSWWLRATNKRKIEQWEIMDDDRYSDLWDVSGSGGTIQETGIVKIMTDPRWGMTHQKIHNRADLTWAVLAAFLNFGPIYIGYYDVVVGGNHVNVIYDMDGPMEYPRLHAMEPAYKRKSNGKYKGMHVERAISYYRSNGVLLASPQVKVG